MKYKGVLIYTGIICYSIVWFIGDEHFRHFPSLEKAKNYIDNRQLRRDY